MGQSAAQPILNLRDKLTGALDKLRSWDKPIAKKAQTPNWKPEPNAEQKAQIARQYGSNKLTKKGTGAKVAPKPAAKKAAKKPAAKRYVR